MKISGYIISYYVFIDYMYDHTIIFINSKIIKKNTQSKINITIIKFILPKILNILILLL